MLRLKCAAQTYAWGRPAAESEVNLFWKATRKKETNKEAIDHSGNASSIEGRHAPDGRLFRPALRLP